MSQQTNREQSAIDAIYDTVEKVNFLSEQVKDLEGKMGLMLSKLDKLNKLSLSGSPVPDKNSSPTKKVSQQKVEKLVLGPIRVFGNIVNKNREPLLGVQVNIYDEENELVKEVKTNDSGFWEVRLPSGRYGVEYLHKNFKPINRTIELKEGIKTFEVS